VKRKLLFARKEINDALNVDRTRAARWLLCCFVMREGHPWFREIGKRMYFWLVHESEHSHSNEPLPNGVDKKLAAALGRCHWNVASGRMELSPKFEQEDRRTAGASLGRIERNGGQTNIQCIQATTSEEKCDGVSCAYASTWKFQATQWRKEALRTCALPVPCFSRSLSLANKELKVKNNIKGTKLFAIFTTSTIAVASDGLRAHARSKTATGDMMLWYPPPRQI